MNRRRRWRGSARGGVGRRRPSIADKKRYAARKRISKLASRRSSTANSEPPAGILGRQTRWRAPPSGRMPCHPSGPWRNSPPGTPVRSRLYRPASPREDAPRSDRTVDKASGAQKIGCLSKVLCGSAAKRKPPLQPKSLCRVAQSLRVLKAPIITLVVGITAEPLPGYVHRFSIPEI
jgi:hypothetical protein